MPRNPSSLCTCGQPVSSFLHREPPRPFLLSPDLSFPYHVAYPIGIFGVACSQFATDFDSPAFRVITAIILVCLVIFWLWLVLYTLPMIISGELLLANARSKLEEEEEAEQHIQHHNSRQMDESRSSVEA
jgi:hypothetical protein